MAKGFSSFKKSPLRPLSPPPPSGLMAVVPVSKIRIWEEKSPPSTLMISREEDERGMRGPARGHEIPLGLIEAGFYQACLHLGWSAQCHPTIKAQRGDETSLSRAGTPLSRGLAEPCRYASVPASLSRAGATDLTELTGLGKTCRYMIKTSR